MFSIRVRQRVILRHWLWGGRSAGFGADVLLALGGKGRRHDHHGAVAGGTGARRPHRSRNGVRALLSDRRFAAVPVVKGGQSEGFVDCFLSAKGFPDVGEPDLCPRDSVSRICPALHHLSNWRRSYSGRKSSLFLSLCFYIGLPFVSGQLSRADDPNPLLRFGVCDHQQTAPARQPDGYVSSWAR